MTRHAPDSSAETASDWIFFVLGGLAAVWLAWVLLRESFTFGWWQIAFALVFWGMLAYLVLPRLHRILTSIYVPDYFIGRTRTSDGLLGDPINLALLGSEAQVHETMLGAGWIRADDLSPRTGMRIVRSTLMRRSYLEAPVSPLLLFTRKQDFAYQQEVNGTPGKRHHVRFWRSPKDWLLPGGRRADWLAAGTYDRSVGFSLFTLQVTHKIAADTDVERDHIVASVTAAEPAITVDTIMDFATGYHARNGGGDSIITDGNLPVIDLRAVPATEDAAHVPTDSRDRRPSPIIVGAVLVALSGLSSTIVGLDQIVRKSGAQADPALTVGFVVAGGVSLAIGVAYLLLAWRVFLGKPRARTVAMLLSVVSIVTQVVLTETEGHAATAGNLPAVALAVLVLLALSSQRARIYARRTSKAPKRISGLPGQVAQF